MKELQFNNAYVNEIIITGLPGLTVHDSVAEVFAWFYDKSDISRCTMVGVNGVKITFERVEK